MVRGTAALLLSTLGVALLLNAPTAESAADGQRAAVWPPGQWSMFQSTPDRKSYTPLVGPHSANLLWRYPTVTNTGGAVIGRDGSVYIGTLEGSFLAFDLDGNLKWSVTTPYTFEATPAVLSDGRIAVVSSHGTLLVLNADGSRSWEFPAEVCVCTEFSPAVGHDGTIYFASNATLYALNSGSILWTYEDPLVIGGPPAVRSDGVVYLFGSDGRLTALNPDGLAMEEP